MNDSQDVNRDLKASIKDPALKKVIKLSKKNTTQSAKEIGKIKVRKEGATKFDHFKLVNTELAKRSIEETPGPGHYNSQQDLSQSESQKFMQLYRHSIQVSNLKNKVAMSNL